MCSNISSSGKLVSSCSAADMNSEEEVASPSSSFEVYGNILLYDRFVLHHCATVHFGELCFFFFRYVRLSRSDGGPVTVEM